MGDKNLYLSMERLRRRSTVDLYWNTVLWSEKLIWSTLAWLPTGTAHCTLSSSIDDPALSGHDMSG